MNTYLEDYLYRWDKPTIRDQDLCTVFLHDDAKRYDAVKYAVRKGVLVKVRRGLYFIKLPYKPTEYDPLEVAQLIYGPSYVSLESALSYHGWIPEAVYTITSVSTRRKKTFETPLGIYGYAQTPAGTFYSEVTRHASTSSISLMAEPWKAIADALFVYRRPWHSVNDLVLDLRVERDVIKSSNLESLQRVINDFEDKQAKRVLKNFLKELQRDTSLIM